MNQLDPFEQIINLLTRNFAEMESKAMQESEFAELSMKQIVYLDTIARLEHPTFSDLAKHLGVTKPSVTAIISKLTQKGYVQKTQSADDKRSFYILLTEKGHHLSQVHDNLHRQIARHFASALDESELHQLARLLQKVVKNYFE